VGDEVAGALKPTLAMLKPKNPKEGSKTAAVPFDEKLSFIKVESPIIEQNRNKKGDNQKKAIIFKKALKTICLNDCYDRKTFRQIQKKRLQPKW
jgi:hypothetical protein